MDAGTVAGVETQLASSQTVMDVQAYLRRIESWGSLTPGIDLPDIDLLRSLHRAHLFTVPFENLDIHLGREIICDESRILHKIVNERRGGFCYELNGAFAALLRALGFRVTLLSGRVARQDGSYGRSSTTSPCVSICASISTNRGWPTLALVKVSGSPYASNRALSSRKAGTFIA